MKPTMIQQNNKNRGIMEYFISAVTLNKIYVVAIMTAILTSIARSLKTNCDGWCLVSTIISSGVLGYSTVFVCQYFNLPLEMSAIFAGWAGWIGAEVIYQKASKIIQTIFKEASQK